MYEQDPEGRNRISSGRGRYKEQVLDPDLSKSEHRQGEDFGCEKRRQANFSGWSMHRCTET